MSDIHKVVAEPSEHDLELLRDKMNAFIFPNIPVTAEETEAYDKAVQYQYEHEMTILEQMNEVGIPEGAASFRIGDFSMNFEDGVNTGTLTMKTICPSAYGVLLRAGLLYRGVERGP